MYKEWLMEISKCIVYKDTPVTEPAQSARPRVSRSVDDELTRQKTFFAIESACASLGTVQARKLLNQACIAVKPAELSSAMSRIRDEILPVITDQAGFCLTLCFAYEILNSIDKLAAKKARIGIGAMSPGLMDRGKNLIRLCWLQEGYPVIDLGKNVGPELFVAAIQRYELDVLGISCMVGKSIDKLSLFFEMLSDRGSTVPVVTGGIALDQLLVDDLASRYGRRIYYGKDVNDASSVLAAALAGRQQSVLPKDSMSVRTDIASTECTPQAALGVRTINIRDVIVDEFARQGCADCPDARKIHCPLETGAEKQKGLEESKAFVQIFDCALLISADIPDENDGIVVRELWCKQRDLEKQLTEIYSQIFAFRFPVTCPGYCLPMPETYNINMSRTISKALERTGGKIYTLILAKQ